MISSKFVLKIHTPKLKIKNTVRSLKDPRLSLHHFNFEQATAEINKISLETKVNNIHKCNVSDVQCTVKDESLNMVCNIKNTETAVSETAVHNSQLNIKKINITDSTDLMKNIYFPVQHIAKNDTFIKKIKDHMMKNKYTSKEYSILGIYSGLPENIDYKYDINKHKLYIKIIENTSKKIDFAILKIGSLRVIKIDL